MKVVLFCGGYGMRLRELTENTPKPLVDIGDRPVLWHLMKYYAHFGHRDFILCLGYKAQVIRDYFVSQPDCTITSHGSEQQIILEDEDWRITFVDTGLDTNIGGRLRRVEHLVRHEDTFLANYADGLTNFPLPAMVERVTHSNAIAAFLAVRPTCSLHAVTMREDGIVDEISDFARAGLRINGGYFLLRSDIFSYVQEGEELVEEPFHRLIRQEQLVAVNYDGFWMCMDTFKEKQRLDDMALQGHTPWQLWKDARSHAA